MDPMRRLLALAALLLLLLAPAAGRATEEYSRDTGKKCSACHVDHGGGGELTFAGKRYAEGGYVWPPKAPVRSPAEEAEQAAPSMLGRAVRAALGVLHLFAAFAWFGTIFYVHLVLRPAYAKGGLPRTEMRIAWGAILILALTGVPLLLFRYPDLSLLTKSRSGILLLVKIGIYLFLVLSAAYVTLVLSPKLKKLRSGWQENDGREGRPAWVKVGEALYDFTESPRWKEGLHMRRHQAGEDLTQALKNAPHGPELLERYPSFSLKDGSLKEESSEIRLLYLFAYVNLFAALALVFVLALRRFG